MASFKKKKKQTAKITPVRQQKSNNDAAEQNKTGPVKKQVCFVFSDYFVL